jgi:hypothetical protein
MNVYLSLSVCAAMEALTLNRFEPKLTRGFIMLLGVGGGGLAGTNFHNHPRGNTRGSKPVSSGSRPV